MHNTILLSMQSNLVIDTRITGTKLARDATFCNLFESV